MVRVYRIFNCFTMEIYRIVEIKANNIVTLHKKLAEIKSQYKDAGYQLVE